MLIRRREQHHYLRCTIGSRVLASTFSTFSDKVLTHDLLLDLVLDDVSPGDLYRLKRTCKRAQAVIEAYIRREFNINRHLLRFFKNPLEFRSLQARTATLISGSNALQFLDRTTHEESDLNLYVYFEHRLEVGRWLMKNGYAFEPMRDQEPKFSAASAKCRRKKSTDGVSSSFSFVKKSQNWWKKLSIQLVVASNAPMDVILNLHSSNLFVLHPQQSTLTALSLAVVLNVISWDRAYSLYPRATFEDRTDLFLRPGYYDREEPVLDRILDKYENLGWQLCGEPRGWYRSQYDLAFIGVARWIGDSHSWVIELDVDGVTLPPPVNEFSQPMTRDPCCLTSWWLKPGENDEPPNVPPKLVHGIQSSKLLTYNYVTLFDPESGKQQPNCQAYKYSREGLRKDQLVQGKHL